MKTSPFITLISLIALFFVAVSCQNEEIKKLDMKQEAENLMQASRDWAKAAEARDVEKTLAYWAEDAVLYSCDQPPLKGKDAIRQMVEGSMNDPNFGISWEPISAEVSENGDMGYLLETSTITMSDSTGVANSMELNSVTIWKKQADGTWKNVVDVMGSSN